MNATIVVAIAVAFGSAAAIIGWYFGAKRQQGLTEQALERAADAQAENTHEDIDRVRDMRPLDAVRAREAIETYRGIERRIDKNRK